MSGAQVQLSWWSGSLLRLRSRCQPGLGFNWEIWLGKDLLPDSHGCWQVAVPWVLLEWGPQFPSDSWPKATSLPCFPGFFLWFLTAQWLIWPKPAWRVSVIKEATILCNIIMEMTSHHLRHILLVRSSHKLPFMLKGRDYARANTEGRIVGGRLQVWLPQ